MGIERDLVLYLKAQLSDTGIFEGGFAERPDNQTTVIHFGGEASEREMGASLSTPPMEIPLVLVMARSKDKTVALTRAQAAYAKLDNLQGMTSTGGIVYLHAESLDGPPSLLEQDGNLRWVYGSTYRIKKAAG